ncbi:uncharacterized protein LOC111731238 [Pteropus vampyrus]|uniref:Uncharacterized protein LOC111731238 n=1 Tax=Pteropus vampyrus TaxID=132908 RepID=A0A6P6BTT0_PTEVA|nr:uncharacterized protein LOC111731238 [Pteropus vampyrus]
MTAVPAAQAPSAYVRPSGIPGGTMHARSRVGPAQFALLGAPCLVPLVQSRDGTQALRPVLDLVNQTHPPQLAALLGFHACAFPFGGSWPQHSTPCAGILRDLDPESLADAEAHTRACALRVQCATPRSLRGAARLGAATPRREGPRTWVMLPPICLSRRRTDSGVRRRNVPPGQERNLTCAFVGREAPESSARPLSSSQTPFSGRPCGPFPWFRGCASSESARASGAGARCAAACSDRCVIPFAPPRRSGVELKVSTL